MSDTSEDESTGFKINEAYASKYNEWRRREELQKREFKKNVRYQISFRRAVPLVIHTKQQRFHQCSY